LLQLAVTVHATLDVLVVQPWRIAEVQCSCSRIDTGRVRAPYTALVIIDHQRLEPRKYVVWRWTVAALTPATKQFSISLTPFGGRCLGCSTLLLLSFRLLGGFTLRAQTLRP
jgi:hypothetical protein